MNLAKGEKGLCTTPEKRSILPSTTMENQEQSEQNALPPAVAPSATSLEDVVGSKHQVSPKAESSETILPCITAQPPTTREDTGSSTKSLEKVGDLKLQASPKSSASETLPGIVPQDTNTSPQSQKDLTPSGESSQYKDNLPQPKFLYGTSGTTIFPGIGPRAVIPRAESPQETVLPSTDLEHHVDIKLSASPMSSSSISSHVTNIGPPAAVMQLKLKQETGLPSTSFELDGDIKLPTSPMASTSKSLPDTTPPVAATQTEPKGKIS